MIDFVFKHMNYVLAQGHPKLPANQYFELFEPAIDWLF